VTEMDLSEELVAEAQRHPRLTLTSSPVQMRFDIDGNLEPF